MKSCGSPNSGTCSLAADTRHRYPMHSAKMWKHSLRRGHRPHSPAPGLRSRHPCGEGKGPRGFGESSNPGDALCLLAAANECAHTSAMNLFFKGCFFLRPAATQRSMGSFNGSAIRLEREKYRKSCSLRQARFRTLFRGGSTKYFRAAARRCVPRWGLMTYQLNQTIVPRRQDILCFFFTIRAIVPGWFDKLIKWRSLRQAPWIGSFRCIPARIFLASSTDGRLPYRQDFITFVDDPPSGSGDGTALQRPANSRQRISGSSGIGQDPQPGEGPCKEHR